MELILNSVMQNLELFLPLENKDHCSDGILTLWSQTEEADLRREADKVKGHLEVIKGRIDNVLQQGATEGLWICGEAMEWWSRLVPSSKRRLLHQLQSQAEIPLVRVNSLSQKERKDNIGSHSPDLRGVKRLVQIIKSHQSQLYFFF